MWFNDIIAIRSFMQTCALLNRDITRCISMILESQRPIGVRYNTLYFNGFGISTPCKGNVSANRMQSDESLLSRAMLRCSLTSPEAMVSQPRV